MNNSRITFERLLEGPNYRVIQIEHPWLDVFGQNVDSRAALLIRATLPRGTIVSDGRGYTVGTSKNAGEHYVVVTSDDVGTNRVFLQLVDFILERTLSAGSATGAIKLFVDAVEEFKNFSARRTGRLTGNEIRGLFAELQMLECLIDYGFDVAQAVSAWKGPFVAEGIGLHDFVLSNGVAIEVKSSQHPATAIRVSSVEQLRPRNFALRLAVLPLEAVAATSATGIDLIDLVERCRERVAVGGFGPSREFDQALDALNLDVDDDYYKRDKYVESPWNCFDVRDGFPVMPVETLARAIFRVNYSLALDELGEFTIGVGQLFSIGAAK